VMYIVVSYDIADDKRRNKVMNELKNYGTHVQYSVFECDLSSTQVREMKMKLRKLIKQSEDSIRYYFLCKGCR
jgi:CRISPR-associated protein Cas2